MRRRKIRQINLRLTEPLRARLEAAAAERQISTNQLMRQLLEDGLDPKPKQSEFLIRSIVEGVAERIPVAVAAALSGAPVTDGLLRKINPGAAAPPGAILGNATKEEIEAIMADAQARQQEQKKTKRGANR